MEAGALRAQQDGSVLLCPGSDTLSPGSRGWGSAPGTNGDAAAWNFRDIVLQEQAACTFL